MTNRKRTDLDRASQAMRLSGACNENHFDGNLQAAANAVTPATIAFD